MRNYTILSEYKRQYLEKIKDIKNEPTIADSIYGDDIELDIYLPINKTLLPFRVYYNNTEQLKLVYMQDGVEYADTIFFKESQRVKEVNIYNLISAADNLVAKYNAAKAFEDQFNTITSDDIKDAEYYFSEGIANKYCPAGYNKKTILNVCGLLDFCYKNYYGRNTWTTLVYASDAKHVFEDLLRNISETTYVRLEEFVAAAVMVTQYKGKFENLHLKSSTNSEWVMDLPDFYDVLSYIRSK